MTSAYTETVSTLLEILVSVDSVTGAAWYETYISTLLEILGV